MSSGGNGKTGLIERESGLIVPASLERELEHLADGKRKLPMAFDPDGRRRVVLPKSTQKKLDQVIIELGQHGFGMVVVCRQDFKRADNAKQCGDITLTERDQTDPGYGCKCSRVHFHK